jgi:hypothetical protein
MILATNSIQALHSPVNCVDLAHGKQSAMIHRWKFGGRHTFSNART